MQQPLCKFKTTLHTSRKRLGSLPRAIEQSDTGQCLVYSRFQCSSAKAIQMSNMLQIFGGREFYVDARSLKDHSDLLSQAVWISSRIEAVDDCASSHRQHQRGKYTEHRRLAAAV